MSTRLEIPISNAAEQPSTSYSFTRETELMQ